MKTYDLVSVVVDTGRKCLKTGVVFEDIIKASVTVGPLEKKSDTRSDWGYGGVTSMAVGIHR